VPKKPRPDEEPIERLGDLPCTLSQYRKGARPLQLKVEQQSFTAMPKEFATGSLGWYLVDKMDVRLDNGITVKVQLNLNFTIVRSKEIPGERNA
jgi:hypothetical protein